MLNLFMQVPRVVRKRLAVRCREVYKQFVVADDVEVEDQEAQEAGLPFTTRQVVLRLASLLSLSFRSIRVQAVTRAQG